MQAYLFLEKLKHVDVNPYIIRCFFVLFFTGRTQQVKVNKMISDLQYISTGVPQGCVSSPVFFTLYTDGCVSKNT